VLAHPRRPVCKACLDWSERRHHLAGTLGAALMWMPGSSAGAESGPRAEIV
jgi:hypothetical protein